MSPGPARQIPSVSDILVVTPAVPPSITLYVCTSGSLNSRVKFTTRIADKDGIWRAGTSDIRVAATHASAKDSAEKLAYRKYLNDLDLETIQMLERDKRAGENIENNLTRTDRQNLGELQHLGERENIPTLI